MGQEGQNGRGQGRVDSAGVSSGVGGTGKGSTTRAGRKRVEMAGQGIDDTGEDTEEGMGSRRERVTASGGFKGGAGSASCVANDVAGASDGRGGGGGGQGGGSGGGGGVSCHSGGAGGWSGAG